MEHREDIAFAREQAKTDKTIRAVSLALGSLPTVGVMAQLAKATQGYKTGTGTGTPPGPQLPPLPKIIQDIIDAGITDVVALINWLLKNYAGYFPSPPQISSFIQTLINAGVTDINSLIQWILNTKPKGTPPSWGISAGGSTTLIPGGPYTETTTYTQAQVDAMLQQAFNSGGLQAESELAARLVRNPADGTYTINP
jgi:hypothetical protein